MLGDITHTRIEMVYDERKHTRSHSQKHIDLGAVAFADLKVWDAIHATATDTEKAKQLYDISVDAVRKFLFQ